MPTPVITDVFRCALEWTNPASSLKPINVLHFKSPGKTASQVGTAIASNWTTNMAKTNSILWVQTAIHVLPLDGTSAETIVAGSGLAGTSTGEYIPAGCTVVSLKTAQRGSRGRGRVYLGPVGEGASTNGNILTADATTMATAWQTFITAMAAAGHQLVIASYVHTDSHPVTNHQVDIPIGTQRRRQDVIAGR